MQKLRLILCQKLEVAKFQKTIFDGSPKMGRYGKYFRDINDTMFLLPFLTFVFFCGVTDLGRMYQLVSRIPDGLGELRSLLESHITYQGTAAIEKCGESALNVSLKIEGRHA